MKASLAAVRNLGLAWHWDRNHWGNVRLLQGAAVRENETSVLASPLPRVFQETKKFDVFIKDFQFRQYLVITRFKQPKALMYHKKAPLAKTRGKIV
jgi:hypothetical protein